MRRRRMTRAFQTTPIDRAVLDGLLDAARRTPTAGNTQGVELLVLDQPESVARYWNTTFTPEGRANFRWQGLFDAPVLVSVYGDPDAYVERYAEQDKARTGLGAGPDAWATPYWLVDASMTTLAVQLAAIDLGLGVAFFGQFDHADAVRATFGVPERMVTTGTIAIGWPAPDEPGRSADRARRPLDDIVHRNGW